MSQVIWIKNQAQLQLRKKKKQDFCKRICKGCLRIWGFSKQEDSVFVVFWRGGEMHCKAHRILVPHPGIKPGPDSESMEC